MNSLELIGLFSCLLGASVTITYIGKLWFFLSKTYDEFKMLKEFVHLHADRDDIHVHKNNYASLSNRINKLETRNANTDP